MGSSNVSAVQLEKDLNAIKALIKQNGYVFLVCGFDQSDTPHICDFGIPDQLISKLMTVYVRAFIATLHCYFQLNNLKKNKPYALKLYVEDGQLAIEYFERLEEILPTLGKAS